MKDPCALVQLAAEFVRGTATEPTSVRLERTSRISCDRDPDCLLLLLATGSASVLRLSFAAHTAPHEQGMLLFTV